MSMPCEGIENFIKKVLFFIVLFIDTGFLVIYYALRKVITSPVGPNGSDLWGADMVVIAFVTFTSFLAILAYTSKD
ncbi:hypothetical protein [Thermococcus sp. Bubb.Bath]|uniref:hypothetical protein n=1 Tax=Thermococcus sp. Bubb.Bath TaxID=1638242 RepID=UPI00143B6E8E|nr:hypothetical protein [Thermococcus sp. Bubb.Bath]NJF25770.1 hypothetical protein [Thermococcus sp. Bubb.Bath]